MVRAVVGLGNPGKQYRNTRHNIGFLVLDSLVGDLHCSFSRKEKTYAEAEAFVAGHPLALIKPLTFMNESGRAVARFLHSTSITSEQLLVVHDDINLEFGRLRIRASGSDGGHKGLASLICHLGSEQIPRLKVGIGGDFHRGQMVDYVLSKFLKSEKKDLHVVLAKASEAVLACVSEGISAAMNKYN